MMACLAAIVAGMDLATAQQPHTYKGFWVYPSEAGGWRAYKEGQPSHGYASDTMAAVRRLIDRDGRP